MGYGDLFVAGVLGAVLARDAALQRAAALLAFVIAALFDLLFLVISELPATVPIALTLIVIEAWSRLRVRSRRLAGPGRRVTDALSGASAWSRRRSTPAGVTPRPAR